MILNIRGALGTQILETLVGLYRNDGVSEIHINAGGDIVEPCKVDYISQLFDIDIPVKVVDGYDKQHTFKEWVNFEILCNMDANDYLKLKPELKQSKKNIMHVRGLDRTIASVDNYKKLLESAQYVEGDVDIIGDDISLIEQLPVNDIAMDTPIVDWYKCVHSKSLYGAFSTFTVSAMMFDPYKKYRVLTKDSSNGNVSLDENYYSQLDFMFKNKFDMGYWISL